jgi:hypothetical protein
LFLPPKRKITAMTRAVTMRWFRLSALLTLVARAAWLAPPVLADGEQSEMVLKVYTPTDVKWGSGPASLPPGAKLAVLEGNPATEGPFVIRLRLPDGYRIAPHTHPKPERVTVISGTFNIGMGDRFDPSKGTAMPAGTFGTWAPGMKHFVWASGETVIQLHGAGPWMIEYVDPADDPRRANR